MGAPDRLPDAGGDDSSGAAHRRVEFGAWAHDSLVRFAIDASKRMTELEADRKLLLEAYRELLRRQ